MYLVLFLTVFVDLITAVLVGAFIANVLTIKRLTDLQSDNIQTITDPTTDFHNLSVAEQEILTRADGQILLFQLGGPMSFGAAKSISRRMSMVKNYEALVLDLSKVPNIGITSALAIESIVQDEINHHRHVWIVVIPGQVQQRLEKLDLQRFCSKSQEDSLTQSPKIHQMENRLDALEAALGILHI
jgi:SulP family sulfate permease